ncbi:MAG: hypothetical protein V8S98_07275 [Lachnospiraceae bacterium]
MPWCHNPFPYQMAYVLAIWFQLFEEEEMEAAGKHLCDPPKNMSWPFIYWFCGNRLLCQAL